MLKNGLLVIMMIFVMTAFSQEKTKTKKLETTTYSCNMHCVTCQQKIEHSISFEKGVKAVTADVDSQSVTVTYKTDKSSKEAIKTALEKMGYKIEVIEKPAKAEKLDKEEKK